MIDYSPKNADEVSGILQEVIEDLTLDHSKDNELGAKKATEHPSTLQLSSKSLLEAEYEKVKSGASDIAGSFRPGAGEFLANKCKSNDALAADLLELLCDEPPTVSFIMTSIQKDFVNNAIPFGHRKIHFKLTLVQMKQLKKHVPALVNDELFLVHYCRKLRPVSDKSLLDDN
eukprot:UN31405